MRRTTSGIIEMAGGVARGRRLALSERRVRSVLVIDDDEQWNRSTLTMLGELGFESELIEAPEVALLRLGAGRWSLAPLDVVLLDWSFDVARQVLALLRSVEPQAPLLVQSRFVDATLQCELRGVCEILSKPYGVRELAASLEHTLAAAPLDQFVRRFSPQVSRVLSLAIEGLDDVAVSEKLGMTVHTVRRHWQTICRELGVSSRAQALAAVIRHVAARQTG
jgi:DNA-binding NarL/FixJ family response regulator